MEGPLASMTVCELSDKVRAGDVTAVAVAEASLARIDAIDRDVHGFLAVARDQMVLRARDLDDKRARKTI
jgi:aspartyl-tRNA(Asn)/glutamyl-tRNA(Gln) amidotransferase subunit A